MKKTNKVHPITFFRKANEARQAVVKKSLKKAQDGIEINDDIINKAGSKGGYKKPLEKYMPWKGPVELITPTNEKRPDYMEPTREYAHPAMNPYYNPKPNTTKYEGPKTLSTGMATMKQKKGGAVKRKK